MLAQLHVVGLGSAVNDRRLHAVSETCDWQGDADLHSMAAEQVSTAASEQDAIDIASVDADGATALCADNDFLPAACLKVCNHLMTFQCFMHC